VRILLDTNILISGMMRRDTPPGQLLDLWVEGIFEIDVSPDPNDNPILAIAVAGGANLVVSGDKRGMLGLGEVHGVPIVTATEALGRLAGLSVEEED
jgi:predicted nucleic acid-binding protein